MTARLSAAGPVGNAVGQNYVYRVGIGRLSEREEWHKVGSSTLLPNVMKSKSARSK